MSSHIQLSVALCAIVDATLARTLGNAVAGRELQDGANPQAVCHALQIAYDPNAHTVKSSAALGKEQHHDDERLQQSAARQARRLSQRERLRQDYHLRGT